MRKIEEIEEFLRQFKVKMTIWDVLFYSREKNIQALADLEITALFRLKVIEGIESQDYSEGPLADKMIDGAEMWVFGKTIKGKEVYIKTTLGKENHPVVCISFHLAEYPMRYPLKLES